MMEKGERKNRKVKKRYLQDKLSRLCRRGIYIYIYIIYIYVYAKNKTFLFGFGWARQKETAAVV